jgi:hypothetical protein
MALIKCPDCGQEVSDSAEKCLNCGKPKPGEGCGYKIFMGIVGVALCLYFVFNYEESLKSWEDLIKLIIGE